MICARAVSLNNKGSCDILVFSFVLPNAVLTMCFASTAHDLLPGSCRGLVVVVVF